LEGWECAAPRFFKNNVTLTQVVEPHQAQEPAKLTANMPAANSGPVVAITPITGVSSNGLAVQAKAEAPSLPPGFPSELEAKMAWTGSSFQDPSEYTLVLDDTEKVELRAAVEHYKCK
jgi:hypothetical protein